MTVAHGFVDGLNHRENHPLCVEKLKACHRGHGEAGFPNVITFSGMRRGMPDDVGLENTVLGLKQVIGLAERKKVNLCLEMLNTRVDVDMKGHPDYMCDKVEWAVEVCQRIGSERMKILFDIYHVQIMQGDIITRIRQYHPYIGHYHVAGVPGRNEIDDTQEINYPADPARDPRHGLYRLRGPGVPSHPRPDPVASPGGENLRRVIAPARWSTNSPVWCPGRANAILPVTFPSSSLLPKGPFPWPNKKNSPRLHSESPRLSENLDGRGGRRGDRRRVVAGPRRHAAGSDVIRVG